MDTTTYTYNNKKTFLGNRLVTKIPTTSTIMLSVLLFVKCNNKFNIFNKLFCTYKKKLYFIQCL